VKPTGLQRAAGDPFLEEFFSRIPREVAVSFTDDQLLAIKLAFAARHRGAHAIDLRVSIPTPFQRVYIVLLAGLERRNAFRRRKDRAASPLVTLGNIIFGALFFGGLFLALMGVLYVLKSALGIDLMPGFSLGLWDGLVDQLKWMAR
jgi:hypothetical protein